jgi:hypothetical protein
MGLRGELINRPGTKRDRVQGQMRNLMLGGWGPTDLFGPPGELAVPHESLWTPMGLSGALLRIPRPPHIS